MKFSSLNLAALALAFAVVFSACSEDSPQQPSGTLDVSIAYTAVRQTESGQYQLGVDFDIAGATGATQVVFLIDGQEAASGVLDSFTALPSARRETFIDINDPGTQPHTLQIIAEDADGVTGQSPETGFVKHQKTILVEIATSANCLPCAASNVHYHQETAGEVAALRYATVKYHVWWPRPTDSLYILSKDQSVPRVKYYLPTYQDWIAPVAFISGPRVQGNAGKWLAQANTELHNTPGALIELEKSDNGSSVDLTVRITGQATGTLADLRLFTVVTESDIYYNDGNPEYIHHDVMKVMLPGWEGESVSIPNGQTRTFQRSITIHDGETKANMEVVVFLQRQGTYEVLQAAKIHL